MSQTFRIAKIIDETTFIITGGISDGIKEGDKFQIVGQVGEEIKDPETGEVLGTLDSVKGTIVATTLYAKMTIARSETFKVGGTINSALLAPSYNLNDLFGHTEHKTLSVDPSQITGGLDTYSDDNPIQVGDVVTYLSSQNK